MQVKYFIFIFSIIFKLHLFHVFNKLFFFSFTYCAHKLFFFFHFTMLYWFCHISTWICHGCACVPYPEPPFHLPPRTIPLGHLIAPAPSIQYHASNLDWWFVSYLILYMFQSHSPKSSHLLPLPQSPKDCSVCTQGTMYTDPTKDII